jgi:hypothetical protein
MDKNNKGGRPAAQSPRHFRVAALLTLQERQRLQELQGLTGRSLSEILISGDLARRGDGSGPSTSRRA